MIYRDPPLFIILLYSMAPQYHAPASATFELPVLLVCFAFRFIITSGTPGCRRENR